MLTGPNLAKEIMQCQPGASGGGAKSCPSVLDLAEAAGVEMPIAEQVVEVCHEGRSARDALAALMDRDAKSELR